MLEFLRPSPSRTRTLITFAFVMVLVAGFISAAYLASHGARDTRNAFDYQSAVVSAQRDTELLQYEQFANHQPETNLRFREKFLDEDLKKIDDMAQSDAEHAPKITFPLDKNDFENLETDLEARQAIGKDRFERALDENERVREVSNALFAAAALAALVFTFFQARLYRRIEQGRSVVETLQRAFLGDRKELPQVGVGSVLISATEGSEVGGDLFDVYRLDENYGAFLIADVSGKGIDAAVDTAFIKYSIRTLLAESRDPGRTVTRFAALFRRDIERLETFVVLFLGIIDTRSGEVRYVSAGHEPAWVRAGGEVLAIAPTGPIVGIPDDGGYETKVLRLGPLDTILITTDGLTESRDARGRQLGAETVAQWFREVDGSTPQHMANLIVQRLRKRSKRIGDDLAILVLRYIPKPGPDARPLRHGRSVSARAPVSEHVSEHVSESIAEPVSEPLSESVSEPVHVADVPE
jgi:serine phosphatase RsbU (regulator of sigma subunit)